MKCDVCQTRMVPGQKECPNCGYKMPTQNAKINGSSKLENEERAREVKRNLLEKTNQKILGGSNQRGQNNNNERIVLATIIIVSVVLLIVLFGSIISKRSSNSMGNTYYPEFESELEDKSDDMYALLNANDFEYLYQDYYTYDDDWGEIVINGYDGVMDFQWRYEVNDHEEENILSVNIDSDVPLSKELLMVYEKSIRKIEEYLGRDDIYQNILNEFDKVSKDEMDYYYHSKESDNPYVEIEQFEYSNDDYGIKIGVKVVN